MATPSQFYVPNLIGGRQCMPGLSIKWVTGVCQSGIESLFSKIGCERLAIDEMLSAEPGVTQTNMLQYLGIVEEQINHLLLMQAFIASQKVRWGRRRHSEPVRRYVRGDRGIHRQSEGTLGATEAFRASQKVRWGRRRHSEPVRRYVRGDRGIQSQSEGTLGATEAFRASQKVR